MNSKEKIDFSTGSMHESVNYGPFIILGLDHIDKHYIKHYRIRFIRTGNEDVVSAGSIKSGYIKDHTYDCDYSVGSIHESNNFGPFKILGLDHIDGYGIKYYRIQFLRTDHEVVIRASHIKDGNIRDALAKTVCDIGYLGMEKIPDEAKRDHTRWSHMLRRCYDPNDPSYSIYGALGITVCERWHCFKNFLEDMPNIPGYKDYINDPSNYHLDKDILQQGVPIYNRIYSPETCMFVPNYVNAAYTTKSGINSVTGYYGVSKYYNNTYLVQVNYNISTWHVGVYENIEIAAGGL